MQPNKLRFVMVGGFLGAGKTTTLARLARDYTARGRKVGIVTNDQATDLVDTLNLRQQGFNVREVAGACFCCNFDELTDRVAELGDAARPDVILAEPVGSCTDLVATVVQPLKKLCADQLEVAPYTAILKPSHGLRILRGEAGGGFSPKAEYIFRKQLQEADAILVNRIDELPAAQVEELTALLERQHPGVPVLRISAKTGQGFDALEELLDQEGDFGRRLLDIDYDTYAEGEAELGWLNASVRVAAQTPFSLDALLLDVVGRLQTSLAAAGAEVAHLKTIGLWEGFFGVANLVTSAGRAELSLPSNCEVRDIDLIVNARVATDPAVLEQHVHKTVLAACAERNAAATFRNTQSFRPGRPVPTHRYASVE